IVRCCRPGPCTAEWIACPRRAWTSRSRRASPSEAQRLARKSDFLTVRFWKCTILKIRSSPAFATEVRHVRSRSSGPHSETCSYRFRSVVCPNQDKVAEITAAKLHIEDQDWSVLECSLQPDGEVNCAMSCLLRDFDKSN